MYWAGLILLDSLDICRHTCLYSNCHTQHFIHGWLFHKNSCIFKKCIKKKKKIRSLFRTNICLKMYDSIFLLLLASNKPPQPHATATKAVGRRHSCQVDWTLNPFQNFVVQYILSVFCCFVLHQLGLFFLCVYLVNNYEYSKHESDEDGIRNFSVEVGEERRMAPFFSCYCRLLTVLYTILG